MVAQHERRSHCNRFHQRTMNIRNQRLHHRSRRRLHGSKSLCMLPESSSAMVARRRREGRNRCNRFQTGSRSARSPAHHHHSRRRPPGSTCRRTEQAMVARRVGRSQCNRFHQRTLNIRNQRLHHRSRRRLHGSKSLCMLPESSSAMVARRRREGRNRCNRFQTGSRSARSPAHHHHSRRRLRGSTCCRMLLGPAPVAAATAPVAAASREDGGRRSRRSPC